MISKEKMGLIYDWWFFQSGLRNVSCTNNFFCISESSQALFTIFNLQLFERVSEGKILLTEGQMDKVLDTVQKFFDANGIEAQ